MTYSQKTQKPPRLQFSHLRGNTSWDRLITWMRRRRLRSFIIYSAVLLFIVFIIYKANASESMGDDFPLFLLIMSIYLLPWCWLLFGIVATEKHHQVRRIKRLGNARRIAEVLEEDLTLPGGILFQKGGAIVTKRFIVDTSFFTFYLYPLEGLVWYDDTSGEPVLYYENGGGLTVRTIVSFQNLKPYIQTTRPLPANVKKPLKAPLFIMVIICIGLFLTIGVLDDRIMHYAGYIWHAVIYGFILLIPGWLIFSMLKNMRLSRLLEEIKDPDERIRKLEELEGKGQFKSRAIYLSQLSVIYSEKSDYEKALELIRQAQSINLDKKETAIGRGMSTQNVLRLNEAAYLIALGQLDEAEEILRQLGAKQYKDASASYNINVWWARLYIEKGETAVARKHLRIAIALLHKIKLMKKNNAIWYLTLLEAECDFLEGDTASALTKLDDIIAYCTWQSTVKRANELKEAAEQM